MPSVSQRLVNLDLDLLRAFVAVAETGSFTRAGARLGRTQSAVSLQIQRLEAQLDVQLFARDPRRVTLTHSGESLLPQARKLLRLNDEIVAGIVEHDLEGEVRFGAPEDFATAHLPGVLGDFVHAYPHVNLSVTCDLTLNLIEAMSRGELDLALIKREPMGPDIGTPVWREELVWVAADASLLQSSSKLPLIAAPAPCVYRKRAVTALEQSGRPWRMAYTSPSLAGQHAALRAGLGITVLPREMAPDDLIVLEGVLPALADAEIALIRAKSLPVAAQRLADFILSALEQANDAEPHKAASNSLHSKSS
ncbi:MAG: LysR family transcriptional regulator [Hyphomonadaceae bacterium]|nr:LysR family transcriptional regulator [Hyphomonadaceae bacterium]